VPEEDRKWLESEKQDGAEVGCRSEDRLVKEENGRRSANP
jgi:hypothetical protein